MTRKAMIDVKIVFTGPNGAGKTSLLFALTGQTYVEYLPSVFPPSGLVDYKDRGAGERGVSKLSDSFLYS